MLFLLRDNLGRAEMSARRDARLLAHVLEPGLIAQQSDGLARHTSLGIRKAVVSFSF